MLIAYQSMPNIEILRHKSSKERCCNSVHTKYLNINTCNCVLATYLSTVILNSGDQQGKLKMCLDKQPCNNS